MTYVLAAVFAVAALAKLRDRDGMVVAAADFGVPGRVASAVATLVVAAELAIAAALLVPGGARAGAVGALVLLAVFTVAIARSLLAGDAVDCHCFGAASARPIGPGALVRNAVLAVAAVAVLTSWPDVGTPDAGSFALGLATGAALFAPLALVALRRHGRLLAQFDPETKLDVVAVPVRVAEQPAPDLGVPAGERPALVVFSSPGCSACDDLPARVKAWRSVVSVIERAYGDDPDAAERAGVRGTPAAVLLSPDRRTARGPAHGLSEIEALVAW